MSGMLFAKRTELVQLNPVTGGTLVLGGNIVPPFAASTGQRYFYAHGCTP
jgi:hypothetical protein